VRGFTPFSPSVTDSLTVVVLDQVVRVYFISFSPSVTDSLTVVVLDQMVGGFYFFQPIGH